MGKNGKMEKKLKIELYWSQMEIHTVAAETAKYHGLKSRPID